jgi:hypothetical protein
MPELNVAMPKDVRRKQLNKIQPRPYREQNIQLHPVSQGFVM